MGTLLWDNRKRKRPISKIILKKKQKLDSEIEEDSDGEDDKELLLEELSNGLQSRLLGKLGLGKRKGKKNHIYFEKDITKDSCRELINEIDEITNKISKLICDYDVESTPKIYLHINSYGGEILPCFGVIDAIRTSKIPIITIIDGASCSAATLISVFGQERWISKHAYMMIHQLRGSSWGTFQEISDEFENKKEIMDRIIQIYTEKTKMKPAELRSLLKHDKYWNAETCLEKGLVDKIV